MSAAATVETARLALLRGLAAWYQERYEDVHECDAALDRCDPVVSHGVEFSPPVPLRAGEWAGAVDDVLLAARECAALGEVELREERSGGGVERTVAITGLGYARIRIVDAISAGQRAGGW